MNGDVCDCATHDRQPTCLWLRMGNIEEFKLSGSILPDTTFGSKRKNKIFIIIVWIHSYRDPFDGVSAHSVLPCGPKQNQWISHN